jgi:hypothetical protein
MSTPDADDLLRRAVAELAARDDCAWAGIYFVEDENLVLGPEAGIPRPERRTAVPVLWRDTRVAELAADGEVDPSELERVATGIADLCLVGWDTGGEVWQS